MLRSKFLAWCHRVQWSAMIHWEFGLSVDHDGGYEGSGVLIRLQWPGFLERWARGFLPPPEPLNRADISDVLLFSLRPAGVPVLPIGKEFPPPTVAWAEDRLATTNDKVDPGY